MDPAEDDRGLPVVHQRRRKCRGRVVGSQFVPDFHPPGRREPDPRVRRQSRHAAASRSVSRSSATAPLRDRRPAVNIPRISLRVQLMATCLDYVSAMRSVATGGGSRSGTVVRASRAGWARVDAGHGPEDPRMMVRAAMDTAAVPATDGETTDSGATDPSGLPNPGGPEQKCRPIAVYESHDSVTASDSPVSACHRCKPCRRHPRRDTLGRSEAPGAPALNAPPRPLRRRLCRPARACGSRRRAAVRNFTLSSPRSSPAIARPEAAGDAGS